MVDPSEPTSLTRFGSLGVQPWLTWKVPRGVSMACCGSRIEDGRRKLNMPDVDSYRFNLVSDKLPAAYGLHKQTSAVELEYRRSHLGFACDRGRGYKCFVFLCFYWCIALY